MMRARPAAHTHADLIGSLVRRHGAELPITEVVRTSWSRCLNNYALDPQETRRPNSVERADLQARRERLGVLLAIARIEMEALGKLIKHSEYSIMLTDRDGVILSYLGDTGFSATARRCGFREGVMWSEREMGTNGMGTCLTAQAPGGDPPHRSFPRAEHRAHLFGGPDLRHARRAAGGARHLRRLLQSAEPYARAGRHGGAERREPHAALRACKDLHLVRFHRCAEFVSTPGEGRAGVRRPGRRPRRQPRGAELLGQRDHDSVCGQRVDRILDTSLATLMRLAGATWLPRRAAESQARAAALVRDRACPGGGAEARAAAVAARAPMRRRPRRRAARSIAWIRPIRP